MSAPSRPVPPQRNLAGILDRLGSGSVRLRSATNFVDIFGRGGMNLAANADYVGGQWVPLDRTQPSALLQLLPDGAWTLYTAPATPSGSITWSGPYPIAGAPATDANGWQVARQGDGKRRWRKRWLGLATNANVAIVAPGFPVALPVGVASLAQVDAFVESRTAGASWEYNAAVEGNDSSTTLKVVIATIDGQNLNVNNATFDLFVELVER